MDQAEKKKRAERELELWRAYKASPTPETLEPLMLSMQNLVQAKVNQFHGAPVPQAALRSFANAQLKRAIDTYNPNKGAELKTHATWYLKKTQSFAIKHQNIGRIPDQRANNISQFRTARTELREVLGHEPDSLSLAEHLGWTQKEVERMEASLRGDDIASKSPEVDRLPEYYSQKDRQVLRYIHYELTPDERTVLEYSLGLYGKPQLPAKEIAKRMGTSFAKISRLRKKIDDKIRERGV